VNDHIFRFSSDKKNQKPISRYQVKGAKRYCYKRSGIADENAGQNPLDDLLMPDLPVSSVDHHFIAADG
jgi:hypothetical protein